jgi:hypothetical protein
MTSPLHPPLNGFAAVVCAAAAADPDPWLPVSVYVGFAVLNGLLCIAALVEQRGAR